MARSRQKRILCQFNVGVECDEYLRFPERCKSCGFNPEVEAQREETLDVQNCPIDVEAILERII